MVYTPGITPVTRNEPAKGSASFTLSETIRVPEPSVGSGLITNVAPAKSLNGAIVDLFSQAMVPARGVRVSVSVALLLAGCGSIVPAEERTVGVLRRLPVAAGLMIAVTVYVRVPPTWIKVMVSLI